MVGVDDAPPLRCTICDCLLVQPGQSRDGRSIAAAEERHYAEQHPLPAPRETTDAEDAAAPSG